MNKTFTEAIYDIFQQISEHNKALGFDEQVTVYLAGGAAVHFYEHVRRSDDVDAIMAPKRPFIPEHIGAVWDNNGVVESVDFDVTYNPTFGLLHEDYMQRAQFLKEIDGSILLYILHPIDLVITKLLRFSDVDAEDIEILVKHDAFDIELFKKLADDAIEVQMVPSHNRHNIQWVIDIYEEMDAEDKSK